jgi:hypothetical protein
MFFRQNTKLKSIINQFLMNCFNQTKKNLNFINVNNHINFLVRFNLYFKLGLL